MPRKPHAVVTEPIGTLLSSVPKSKPSWVTVVKTTLAATLAWVLARQLGHNVAVLFAPVVALLTLQASVYGSVATGLQLLFANLVGTAMAIAWTKLVGLTWWSFGLAAFGALALARQVTNTPLARNQVTIATLVVFLVAPAAHAYGQWRFLDVAIGSVVGLAIAVLVPERPRVEKVRDTLRAWGDACAGVLRDIAAELGTRADDAEPLDPQARHGWIAGSRRLGELNSSAATAVAGVEEVTLLDVGARRHRRKVERVRREQLWLTRITLQVRGVALAVDRLYDREGARPAVPPETLRPMLEELAALLQRRVDDEPVDDARLRVALVAAVEHAHTAFPSAVAVLDSLALLGRLDQLRQDIAGEDAAALHEPDASPQP